MLPAPRPFAGSADLELVPGQVRQRPATRLTRYPCLVDLRELLTVHGSGARAWLWEQSGIFLGFSLQNSFERERHLYFEPAASSGEGSVTEMLTWGLQTVSEEAESDGRALDLAVGDRMRMPGLEALLVANGFRRRRGHTLHFSCPLCDPNLPQTRRADTGSVR